MSIIHTTVYSLRLIRRIKDYLYNGRGTSMKCPYCNQEMQHGSMHPLSCKNTEAIYWIPENSKIRGLFLSVKKIKECGGLVFTSCEFDSENKVQTYYCEICKILFTKIDE